MDGSAAEARTGATARRPFGPVWWALGFGALVTVGLGGLTCALLVLHALGYGAMAVVAPDAGAVPPDGGRYGLAFAVGVLVHVACASALLRLAPRTAVRAWPPVAQGLGAALLAATVACCALLLTLGISPVDVVLGS